MPRLSTHPHPQEADTLYEVAEEERLHGCVSAGGSRGSGTSGLRWGADAQSSCIFESLPAHRCAPQLRSDYAAYRAARSRWPLRPGVWRLLFQSRLTQLVLALLGPEAVLFNDQVCCWNASLKAVIMTARFNWLGPSSATELRARSLAAILPHAVAFALRNAPVLFPALALCLSTS